MDKAELQNHLAEVKAEVEKLRTDCDYHIQSSEFARKEAAR
jgi:hypothetical protein